MKEKEKVVFMFMMCSLALAFLAYGLSMSGIGSQQNHTETAQQETTRAERVLEALETNVGYRVAWHDGHRVEENAPVVSRYV